MQAQTQQAQQAAVQRPPQKKPNRPSNPWKQPSVYSVMAPLCKIQHHKSNSTSSIFTSSNITEPRVTELVSSVATMLHCQMMRDREQAELQKSFLPFFAEEQYTQRLNTEIPTVSAIFGFLKQVFEVGQFHPECCVISLVYVNRLIGVTGVALSASNWKPITISSLVIAQKVWDDTPLINADFSILYPPLTVKEINYLERKLLDLLEFKLTVSPSLYAQYYFELRSICEDSITFVPDPRALMVRRNEPRVHLAEQYQRRKKEYKKLVMTPENLITAQRRHIMG